MAAITLETSGVWKLLAIITHIGFGMCWGVVFVCHKSPYAALYVIIGVMLGFSVLKSVLDTIREMGVKIE